MRIKSSISLKQKLISLILIIIFAAVFTSFLIDIIYNIDGLKKYHLEKTILNAKLLAEYCRSPVIFNDSLKINEIMNRLNRNKLQSLDNGLVASISYNDYVISNDANESLDLLAILTR